MKQHCVEMTASEGRNASIAATEGSETMTDNWMKLNPFQLIIDELLPGI